jgi:hypothetical protein
MTKKINPQHQSEKRGLRALQTYVEELGWIFRPTPNDDYGCTGPAIFCKPLSPHRRNCDARRLAAPRHRS